MALDWIPIVPDLPPRAPRPPWRHWTTWRFPIVVPDLLASETFQPSYPDRVPSRGLILRPAERSTFSAALSARTISPVDWYHQRPDRGSDRRPHLTRERRPAGDPPSPGAGAVVAASLAWRAQLPDRAPAHRGRPPEGVGTPRYVQPLVPIGTGACVEWGPETWTHTLMQADAATLTGVVSEAFAHTTFTGEGLC